MLRPTIYLPSHQTKQLSARLSEQDGRAGAREPRPSGRQAAPAPAPEPAVVEV